MILDRRNTINTLAPCWNYTWLRVRRPSADTAWVPINYVTIWSQSAQNATNVFDLQKTRQTDWTIDKPKLTTNARLLLNSSFKRALNITNKLANNSNKTLFRSRHCTFSWADKTSGKLWGDKGCQTGDTLKLIRIQWDTFISTLYRLQTTYRDGARQLIEQT